MKGQLKAIYFLLKSNVKNKGPSLVLILAHITCTKQMEMIFLQLLQEFNQKCCCHQNYGLKLGKYSKENLEYFSFQFHTATCIRMQYFSIIAIFFVFFCTV